MCVYGNYPLRLSQEKHLEDIRNVYEANRAMNVSETRERKILLQSKPTALMIILTSICNLKCVMCIRVRNNPAILPFEWVKKIYKLFPYLGLIDWQGGEVFLVDYFKELFLRTASYPHILQHITTNGLLIDEEWANILAQSNVNLLYSIDSVDKDTYESIRLGGKFDKLTKGIDLVNEFKRRHNNNHNQLEINAVVMKRNYKTLHLFPRFCKEHNFKSLNFDLLMPQVIPEEDIVSGPDLDAILYLNELIPQVEAECNSYNIFFNCTFNSYIKKIAQDFLNKDANKNNRQDLGLKYGNFETDCTYPWKRLHIEIDGQVYPACQCSLNVGKLNNDSLEDIWNSPTMQLYRKSLNNNDADKICSKQCHFSAAVGRKESIDVPE